MRLMFDSTTPERSIPADAQMVAGYVNGNWPNFPLICQRWPNAVHVSIAVTTAADAMVLDVEVGDATPADAPAWCQRQRAQGQEPTVYCNTSTWPSVRAAFHVAGVGEPCYWLAEYDGVAQIPAGAIAKQYRSDTAQNLDYSVVADYWPGVDPPAPKEETIMATDTDRGGLVRLTYLSVHGREPTPQAWGIGQITLAQSNDLDSFVASVADSASGQAAERARSPQP